MKIHPAAWSLFLLLAAGLVVAAFYAATGQSDRTPDLVVPTTDNGTFQLSGERGHVVVLDFFNVYCESCAIVEGDLKSLLPVWNGTPVRVVSVGVGYSNGLDDLARYQAEHSIPWTVASDTDRAVEKFDVFALPTLGVVDADGHLVYLKAGVAGRAEIERTVADAVAAQAVPVGLRQYSLWGLAVVAGVASFFSPCAIGLLPGYVAHTLRTPDASGRPTVARAARLGLVAASGLVLVFLGVGALAYAFGRALAPYVSGLGPFTGVLFLLVGLLLLARPYSLTLQRVLSPLTRIPADADARPSGALGHFLYGLGYGAGAAGCTAPVLLSLVGLAASAGAHTGVAVILVYAASAGLLMGLVTVIVALGRQGFGDWIRRHAHAIEVVSALLFVGAGAFLLLYAWRAGTLHL